MVAHRLSLHGASAAVEQLGEILKRQTLPLPQLPVDGEVGRMRAPVAQDADAVEAGGLQMGEGAGVVVLMGKYRARPCPWSMSCWSEDREPVCRSEVGPSRWSR